MILNQKQLSEHLKVSIRTIIRYTNKRKIPYMLIGKSVRYSLQEVEDALRVKPLKII